MHARATWPLTLAPAAILLAALAAQIAADPASGVTFSNSPFTDEGWNVMGARNWVLLGDWSAGNWVLHLVQLPFTVLEAIVFRIFGVGIVQARLLPIACSVASVGLAGVLVQRRFGWPAGVLAAAALGSTSLVLYYGRLAFLEDLVMLALVAGAALLCRREPRHPTLEAVAVGVLLALAIGTKPLALFPAVGILAGAAVAGRRSGVLRRSLVAGGVIGAAGLGWLLLVALPNRDAVQAAMQIWTPQQLPPDLETLIYRVTTFPQTDSMLFMSLPLAIGGLLGLVAVVTGWRRLDTAQRVLAGAAIGWLVVGVALLMVASYRPGRYALPILPALAILTGYLVPAARRLAPVLPRAASAVLLAAALAGVVLPGAVMAWGWASAATFDGPRLQERFAAAVQPAEPIEGGLAGFLAMRVPAPIYVRWSTTDLNTGDLYADAGVRWVVATGAYRPPWADNHPDVWDGRQELFCVSWGKGTHCLERLPGEQ